MKKLIIALGIISLITACNKKYDEPIVTFADAGEVITMDTLLNKFVGYPIKFEENLSMYATVTMDETDGNIYKSVYIQDGNKALNLRLLNGGGLYKGDSIRIDLKGTVLNQYNGVMQLDSVDIDKNIVKLEANVNLDPLVLTLDQLNTNLQSRLIKLENVQFIAPQITGTYADGTNQEDRDIIIEDANGNTAILRNSGYSNFADEMLAQGSGSIVCIVGIFGNSVQLLVRSFSEINMTGPRFAGILYTKDFNDGSITSDDWSQYSVMGPEVVWETSSAGGAETDYAVIRNYVNNVNVASENWLISPAYDLSGLSAPYFTFQNAYNYSGNPIQVFVSTDYDGSSNPTTQGNWTSLPFTLSGGSWTWVSSGNIDLSSYTSNNVHIAIQYTGGSTGGSTWEIDDLKIIG